MPYAWPPVLSNSTASTPVISPYPFTLKVLNNRIQICQACRIPFHSSSTEPPYDLVITRKECRPYHGQGSKSITPSMPSNSHYHVSMHCLRAADPFSSHELVIPNEVCKYLSDTHRGFLYASLRLHI